MSKKTKPKGESEIFKVVHNAQNEGREISYAELWSASRTKESRKALDNSNEKEDDAKLNSELS